MPRHARLDIPGLLQHVIVRGIEGADIYLDDADRGRFVVRLSTLLLETDTDCLAWALIPNHFHLLLRSNRLELSLFMRRLLTGYAVTFNRRHGRSGHLFQNRYKSMVCEEDPYLLELIRYIHLNPLRAGLVQDLNELERYPWCGHGALLGQPAMAGQMIDEVLALFANNAQGARYAYRQFLAAGVAQGQRPELVGGGLRRSRTQEGAAADGNLADERVLGSGSFVASLRGEPRLRGKLSHAVDLDSLQVMVCDLFTLPAGALQRRGRRNQYAAARELFCYLGVRELGYSGAQVGLPLSMGSSSVCRAVRRGEELVASRPEVAAWWTAKIKQ